MYTVNSGDMKQIKEEGIKEFYNQVNIREDYLNLVIKLE